MLLFDKAPARPQNSFLLLHYKYHMCKLRILIILIIMFYMGKLFVHLLVEIHFLIVVEC